MSAQARASLVRSMGGLLFVLAGIAKLHSPCAAVGTAQGLPGIGALAELAVGAAIALEIGIGAAVLLYPSARRPAVVLASFLAVFCLVLGYGVLRHGFSFRCGCMPGILDAGAGWSLTLNLVLLSLLLLTFRRANATPSRVVG